MSDGLRSLHATVRGLPHRLNTRTSGSGAQRIFIGVLAQQARSQLLRRYPARQASIATLVFFAGVGRAWRLILILTWTAGPVRRVVPDVQKMNVPGSFSLKGVYVSLSSNVRLRAHIVY